MAGCCSGLPNWFYNVSHTPISRRNFLIGFLALVVLIVIIIILAATLSGSSSSPEPKREDVPDLVPLSQGISGLLRDAHRNYGNSLAKVTDDIMKSLKSLKEGKVNIQLMMVGGDCDTAFKDALGVTLDQVDLLNRLVNNPNNSLSLVTSASDMKKSKDLRLVAGLSGGHTIDSRPAALRTFAALGVRILALNGTCNRFPWISEDNKTLTDFGKGLLGEARRLGMILDLTGTNPDLVRDVYGKVGNDTPVIFSHSNYLGLTNHPLNLDNDTLKLVAANGGLVMVSFAADQLRQNNSKTVNIADLADHINSLKETMKSTRHIGLGGAPDQEKLFDKYDGKTVYKDLFKLLSHWTVDELKDIAFNNFHRVFQSAEKIKKQGTAFDDTETIDDFKNITATCYTEGSRPPITTTTVAPSTTTKPKKP